MCNCVSLYPRVCASFSCVLGVTATLFLHVVEVFADSGRLRNDVDGECVEVHVVVHLVQLRVDEFAAFEECFNGVHDVGSRANKPDVVDARCDFDAWVTVEVHMLAVVPLRTCGSTAPFRV
jgi:hypothetical protein